MNPPSQNPAAPSAFRARRQRTAGNLPGVQCIIEPMSKSALPVRLVDVGARRGPHDRLEPEMSKVLAALVGWRGAGAAIAPYVLLAVLVPGGMAIAPLLYWRNRKRP